MTNIDLYDETPFGRWLLDRDESAYQFSRRTFISVPTVYKAMRGDPLRCSTIKRILFFAKKLAEEDFKISNKRNVASNSQLS